MDFLLNIKKVVRQLSLTVPRLLTFKISIIMGQNSATRHKGKNDRPGNQSNGTNVDSSVNFKFDDDAGLKIKQYTNELRDVHPDPDGLLPPTRPKKICDSKYADALKNGDLVSLEMMLTGFDANIRDPQTGRIALSIAAETGNSQIAELLLKNGADVNNRQYSISGKPTRPTFQQEAIVLSGRTPLHWAIAKKHTDIVKLLLQHGANPNARNSAGRTVLQEACYTNHPESAELLLQSGADINGISLHSVSYYLCSFLALETRTNSRLYRDGHPSTKLLHVGKPYLYCGHC